MQVEELRECLRNSELRDSFYEELGSRFRIDDSQTLDVMRYFMDDVISNERENEWCMLKTLYARTKVRTSLNDFHYNVIPMLVRMGFLELKMFMAPTGEYMRVVRLCMSFVIDQLCPIMAALKE